MNAIEVEHLWKKFRLSRTHPRGGSLRDTIPQTIGRLFGRNGQGDDTFWALKDVSISVAPGEALGIIGPNGAGKSTILKLLAGILRPDRGAIRINGRVAALIDLGAGFHPDLTGRENVYLNGAIMGLKKRKIDRKFDEIVEFAGIEEFIDIAIKRYSSGMTVRLGFAVAAHTDPDLLLIDEVLAVGDTAFQAKCLEHVSRLCRNGCTVILVSHNEELVRRMCGRGVLLERGRVVCEGDVHRCFAEYNGRPHGSTAETHRAGNGKVEIVEVEFLDEHGNTKSHFRMGAPITVRVHLLPREPVANPVLDVGLNSAAGVVASAHTGYAGYALGPLREPSVVELYFPALNLAPGVYRVTGLVCDEDLLEIYDWRRNTWEVVVENDFYVRGAVWLPFEFRGMRPEPEDRG